MPTTTIQIRFCITAAQFHKCFVIYNAVDSVMSFVMSFVSNMVKTTTEDRFSPDEAYFERRKS